VALTFNPRFKDGVVVRNSKENSEWGEEERDGALTIRTGSDCTITIICEELQFKVIFIEMNFIIIFSI
jgi:tectonin beta-propeller repeat-containing protein 1